MSAVLLGDGLKLFTAGDLLGATRLWLQASVDLPDNAQLAAYLRHVQTVEPQLYAQAAADLGFNADNTPAASPASSPLQAPLPVPVPVSMPGGQFGSSSPSVHVPVSIGVPTQPLAGSTGAPLPPDDDQVPEGWTALGTVLPANEATSTDPVPSPVPAPAIQAAPETPKTGPAAASGTHFVIAPLTGALPAAGAVTISMPAAATSAPVGVAVPVSGAVAAPESPAITAIAGFQETPPTPVSPAISGFGESPPTPVSPAISGIQESASSQTLPAPADDVEETQVTPSPTVEEFPEVALAPADTLPIFPSAAPPHEGQAADASNFVAPPEPSDGTDLHDHPQPAGTFAATASGIVVAPTPRSPVGGRETWTTASSAGRAEDVDPRMTADSLLDGDVPPVLEDTQEEAADQFIAAPVGPAGISPELAAYLAAAARDYLDDTPVSTPSAAPQASEDPWQADNDVTQPVVVVSEGAGLALVSSESRSSDPVEPLRTGELPQLRQKLREQVDLDDFSGAHKTANRILEIMPDDSDAASARDACGARLKSMYSARVGALSAVPVVLKSPDEVIWLDLDHRSGFVLAQIDGVSTYEDIIELTGMAPLESFRILAALVTDGVIGAPA